jgi:hypothetical protein
MPLHHGPEGGEIQLVLVDARDPAPGQGNQVAAIGADEVAHRVEDRPERAGHRRFELGRLEREAGVDQAQRGPDVMPEGVIQKWLAHGRTVPSRSVRS